MLKKIERIIICCVMLLSVVLAFSGCSKRTKSEKEIKKDLQMNANFYSVQEVTIKDLEIIKRQTDTKNKYDNVFVTVKAENENISCELSYYMRYNLYNEGWVLDSVTRYEKGKWDIIPLKGPDIEEFVNDYHELNKEYNAFYFEDSELIVNNRQCEYSFNAEKDSKYIYALDNITLFFEFNTNTLEWEKTDMQTETMDVKAKNISGTWVPMSANRYDMADKVISISLTDNKDVFNVKVYKDYGKKLISNQDIEVEMTSNGFGFTANPNCGLDTLDVYINPEEFKVSGYTGWPRIFVKQE